LKLVISRGSSADTSTLVKKQLVLIELNYMPNFRIY